LQVESRPAARRVSPDSLKRPWCPQFAAHGGFAEAADFLLAAGAAPDHRELRTGSTALHFAASGGHVSVAEVLLASGADPNAAVPQRGWTPLHHAAGSTARGAADLAGVLAAACGTGAKAEHGVTPLMVAAKTGNAALCQVLLAHTDPSVITAVDTAGLGALEWAVLMRHQLCGELIFRRLQELAAAAEGQPDSESVAHHTKAHCEAGRAGPAAIGKKILACLRVDDGLNGATATGYALASLAEAARPNPNEMKGPASVSAGRLRRAISPGVFTVLEAMQR